MDSPHHDEFHPRRRQYAMDYANGKLDRKADIERAKFTIEKVAGAVRIRAFDPEKAPNFLMVVGESIIFGKK